MDLEELKNILQKDKGKIIIVENGKPLMVIVPYEALRTESPPEESPDPRASQQELEPEPGELTIDDLPI
jgi:hypothetical protein